MSRKHLVKLLTLCSIWPGLVFAASLAEVPLSLRGSVPPNVMFSISVEFPTANTAAYQGASDYEQTGNYLGLFDKDKCYDYDAGNQWFAPISAAANHVCTGHWSGNFLNWVSMTGLDAFRYAMTGGNRYRDDANLTVLERTYQSGQGGTSNFPDKTFNPVANVKYAYATPYVQNVTYTIANQGKGVRMNLTATETKTTTNTATGSSTVTCSAAASPTWCSSIKIALDNTAGSCSVWATTGSNDGSTSAKPVRCTSFGTFSSGATTITGINAACNATAKNAANKWICTSYTVNYSKTTTTTGPNPINVDYYVRAKVCDPTAAVGGLESNCAQYGTSYKPIGVIQENGEKMRFGVFSYYNANDIDNAVMRSPLKYVAPDRFTTAGVTSNPNKEWNAANGVLVDNPDSAASAPTGGFTLTGMSQTTFANTGVINYLNKFGSTSGNYKTYDTVGKLYYETLNYLRGRDRTTAFFSNATNANADGFPVVNNNWKTDPQEFSCQQNYIIAMGDTHTWCDKRLPGGSYANSNNGACNANGQPDDKGSLGGDAGLNVTTLTNLIGNNEGIANLATKYTGAGNSASYYMGGLAYWAATHDIRPDDASLKQTLTTQNVKTYVIDVEEYKDLGIGSQYWLAAKYGGADSYKLDANNNPMPNDWSNNVTITAPFADYNGAWPKALLRAGDPAMMIAAVRSAIAKIVEQIGNNSALSQSTSDLRTSDGAYIYRAIFDSQYWSGDVQAYKIIVKDDGSVVVDPSPTWTARPNVPVPGNRVILTYNDGLKTDGTADSSNSNAHKGIAFDPTKFSGTGSIFSERQRDFLNRDNAAVLDNFGADRIRWMRGESSNEGNLGHKWRSRDQGTAGRNVLGDIINSNPVYVSRPAFGLTGAGYADFVADNKGRTPMLYVGANDGMLHGIDASLTGTTQGKELLAYVPSAVYSRLNNLMSATYNHKYYVDGSPSVDEACFGTCSSKSDWKTVLVGGLNAGGQGIYALDVTDPSKFDASKASDIVLWEFTDRDDPDLGFTFSKPIIRKMNNGRWAVIFGNGFNSTASDAPAATKSSTTGRAYLYIAWIDGPSDKTWTAGTGTTDDYVKIALPTPGTTDELTSPNGLASAAAIDTNLDGAVDYIYAGDRKGHLWKIDVSKTDPKDWKPAFGTDAEPQPLFTASYKDKDNNTISQGVTTGVEVSAHPNGGYLVMFGTGSFIDTTDNIGPFKTDSFYGIWDKNDGTTRVEDGRTKLQQQSVLKTITDGGEELLFMSRCIPNYTTETKTSNETNLCPAALAYTGSGQQLGWYFDLPADGERVASELPLLQSTILTFTTLQPSDDPCTGNTVGREYNLDYLTGGAALTGVFDLNQDGIIDANDMFNIPEIGEPGEKDVAPSGRVLKGGKSDTGIRFTLPRAPTGTDHVCKDFIPGWGCPSEMAPQRNCSRWVYDATSAEDLTKVTTSGIEGMKKCLPGKPGRFTWRQIAD